MITTIEPAAYKTPAAARPEWAVEVAGLRLNRGKTEILKGFDLRLPKGKLVSILGPNGTGKTTFIRVLTGGLTPNAGAVKVNGFDVTKDILKIKQSIGITPQDNNLYENLTAADNLRLHGQLFGMSDRKIGAKLDSSLASVNLLKEKNQPVRKFSGGMKRRLAIARSTFAEPEILFLDEPTTALDPEARKAIWAMLAELKKRQVSIILTTHYMEEAEVLSDYVVVMDRGTIIAYDTPLALRLNTIGGAFVELVGLSETDTDRVKSIFLNVQTSPGGDKIQIPMTDLSNLPNVIHGIQANKIRFTNLFTRQSTLEDVFFKLTGGTLRGGQTDAIV